MKHFIKIHSETRGIFGDNNKHEATRFLAIDRIAEIHKELLPVFDEQGKKVLKRDGTPKYRTGSRIMERTGKDHYVSHVVEGSPAEWAKRIDAMKCGCDDPGMDGEAA